MYKVYILKSLVNKDKSYVGKTIKPIEIRLNEHNKGLSRFTKIYKPWKLIYYEQFYCQVCAEKREVFLKSGLGYKIRKLIVEHYIS